MPSPRQGRVEFDFEHLRSHVEQIAGAVEKLRESGISERALILLIQHSAGTDHRGRPIPQKTIRAVMDGMEGLHEFVYGESDSED